MDRHITGGTKGKGWSGTVFKKPQAIAEESEVAESLNSVAATQRLVGRGSIRDWAKRRGTVGCSIKKPHTIPEQQEGISAVDCVVKFAEQALIALRPELYSRNRTVEAASDKKLAG
jgi:hypothetical protein